MYFVPVADFKLYLKPNTNSKNENNKSHIFHPTMLSKPYPRSTFLRNQQTLKTFIDHPGASWLLYHEYSILSMTLNHTM